MRGQLKDYSNFVIPIETAAGPDTAEGISRMMPSKTVANKGLCSHHLTGLWEENKTEGSLPHEYPLY